MLSPRELVQEIGFLVIRSGRRRGDIFKLDRPRNLIGRDRGVQVFVDDPYVSGQHASIRESLDSPITVDPDGGLWLNLYDPQDPIAFPLEPIESYRAVGVIDRVVGAGNWLTGWNLLSHTGYWHCEEAARLVGRKLALDWARLNSPRFAERDYERALAAFHKDLRRKP